MAVASQPVIDGMDPRVPWHLTLSVAGSYAIRVALYEKKAELAPRLAFVRCRLVIRL